MFQRRKITRLSLAELAKVLPVIPEEECRTMIGGGNGSRESPYTLQEYNALCQSGSFLGGFVDPGNGQEPDYIIASAAVVVAKRRDKQPPSGIIFEHERNLYGTGGLGFWGWDSDSDDYFGSYGYGYGGNGGGGGGSSSYGGGGSTMPSLGDWRLWESYPSCI